MAVFALVLYITWLLLGFALRSRVQRSRTGDSGVRGFGGRRGSTVWWASLLLALAHVGGVVGPLAAVLGLPPVAVLADPAIQAVGVVLAVVGVGLTVLAQLSMGASWRIGVDGGERTTLVTAGPFRVVRNPIFSAVGLTSLGIALMVPNVVALVVVAALFVALQLQVRLIEEPYLRRTHGSAYARYTRRVGRFVPGLGRG